MFKISEATKLCLAKIGGRMEGGDEQVEYLYENHKDQSEPVPGSTTFMAFGLDLQKIRPHAHATSGA